MGELAGQLALSLTPEQVEMFTTLFTERREMWRKKIEEADAANRHAIATLLKGALAELVVLGQLLDIETKGV